VNAIDLLSPFPTAEYEAAVKREQEIRDIAFLPIPESICGFDVVALTPERYLLLDISGSAFLHGCDPMPEDIAQFLWIVSPKFSTDLKERDAFIVSTRGVNYSQAVSEIRNYIDDARQDSPASSTRTGPPFASLLSGIVDAIASEYGWSEQAILALPLKRLFQYIRRIQMRRDGRTSFISASDKITNDWLCENNTPEKVEARRKAEAEAAQ
jgi:hypothetical protein